MVEQFVKYWFIVLICLTPLDFLGAVIYARLARKALINQKPREVLEHKTRAAWRVTTGLTGVAFGSLGYYLVTRRVFPWLDAMWLLLLTVPVGLVGILFTRRLDRIRRLDNRTAA